MSFFSSLKKVVKAHVQAGIAPLQAARGLTKASYKVTKAATKASLRYSPHAVVVRKLRSAAKRAPKTPIKRSGGWGVVRAGAARPVALVRAAAQYQANHPGSKLYDAGNGVIKDSSTGQAVSLPGGGGGGASYDDGGGDYYDGPETDYDGGELPEPELPEGDDGADDDPGLGAVDYDAYLDDGQQLRGWTDDLAKIGVNLAKGAASGILNSAAGQMVPRVAVPPPPAAMSGTVKIAIAAAIGVPLLYLLTRKRSAAPTPVAA